VPVEDVPRRDGQLGEGHTVRGLGPARESTDISRYRGIEDFMGGGLKQSVPTFDGKIFPRYKQEAIFFAHHYGFESVFTDAGAQRDVNVGDTDESTARSWIVFTLRQAITPLKITSECRNMFESSVPVLVIYSIVVNLFCLENS